MKKLVYILFFNLFCLTGYSQYNLQFNQVLTFTGLVTGTYTVGTVPSNKVWKIETFSSDINQIAININGIRYDFNYGGAMNTSPIWLKAGDSLSVTSQNGGNRPYVFSIIEFNLTP
jgi:hypothetical protein